MKRITIALLLALKLCAAADEKDPKAASAQGKKEEKDVNLKVTLDKATPPAATATVRYAFTATLPYFCIAKGLDATTPPSQKTRCAGDGLNFEKVYPNADNIVEALKTATQFTIQKADNANLLFFCAVKTCNAKDIAAIKAAVAGLSQTPSPRYFEDVVVPAAVTDPQALANSIQSFSKGKVNGRVVRFGQSIRLETDNQLDTPFRKFLIGKIQNTSDAELKTLSPFVPAVSASRIDLPTFCLAGDLATAAKQADKCDGPPQRLVPTANATQIATALTGDKIKVAADSPSSLIVSCGAQKCDSTAIQMINDSAAGMAHPKPAYTQDLSVLTGTAETAVTHIAKWANSPIAADVISADSIRLKSDVPIDGNDITALSARLRDAGFGPTQLNPANRLFYADAGAITSRLATIPVPAVPATPSNRASTPASTYGMGMTPVGDSVVLSGDTSVSDDQRVRLLTLLDLPRPEVLLNLWSLQESSPNGKEVADNTTLIRSTVALHNEALQNAIEYGWSYLSRRMQEKDGYFDTDFTNYLTQRYVADSATCEDHILGGPGCVGAENRRKWGFCPLNQYCLGYTEAFRPIRPTLTNILLGLMAAKDPVKAVFTTLGCMEGKFEAYGDDCFKDRNAIKLLPLFTEEPTKKSHEAKADPDEAAKKCLPEKRQAALAGIKSAEPSCEDLDRAALTAQRECKVHTALPLSCFTIQAAQSFVPFHGFSTFTATQLNGLAEANIPQALAQAKVKDLAIRPGALDTLTAHERSFSATPLGLLRAATTNFLFNYKMAQQFPKEFAPYYLTHSAQELNAEFNPLIVAFNQDVSVFSEDLRQILEDEIPTGRNKQFLADGSITVRGISGVESFVDTQTMSAFSAPQYQTLPDVLNNLAGLTSDQNAPAPGSTTTTQVTNPDGSITSTTAPTASSSPAPLSSSLTSLLPSFLSRASLPVALASAILPKPATAQIGRQLTLNVTPHTLPGASSAELEVNLIAQEDSPPTLYSDHGATQNTDPISRVAKHNVTTRVRVESIKLFEVSSFSALIERPRTNLPLLPIPFVEVPIIGDFLSLPLRGAKVYHRSTAIVSAVIVPTAADLAFGLQFHGDREVVDEVTSLQNARSYYRNSFKKVTSQTQLPWNQRSLYGFNQMMTQCFAAQSSDSNARVAWPSTDNPSCGHVTFEQIAPDR